MNPGQTHMSGMNFQRRPSSPPPVGRLHLGAAADPTVPLLIAGTGGEKTGAAAVKTTGRVRSLPSTSAAAKLLKLARFLYGPTSVCTAVRLTTAGDTAIDTRVDASSKRVSDPHPEAVHAGGIGFLALTALGVVFGDIGTSPLYAFSIALNATGHPVPTPADVKGVVSLIFWALMIMVSLKYVLLVLRADNDGEGGILALLSLVEGNRLASGLRISLPMILGILGASLLYGDGVITPAISVLSAMEGLKLITPGFSPFILPGTLAILVGLFAIQRYGTHLIGRLFGPVMVVWFMVIGVLGIVNIAVAPGIVTALNPVNAVATMTQSPVIAAAVFGAIFLALTGGEALYADMGHVGAPAIRLAWFGLVLPALVLNYFGQGALMLADPQAADSPFFKLAPIWALVPIILLATLATVIASQALISGVFSLTRQAVQMGFCPRVRIIPTSSDEAGQIYVPSANWLLMAGTLLIVVMFKSSDALGSAYGVAVSGTMLATTVLLYYLMTRRWRVPILAAAPLIAVFGAVDCAFLAANSLKIFDGGWFPLTVGGIVASLMWCWRRGTSEVRRRLHEMSMPVDDFIANLDGMLIGRCPGTAVWLTKVEHGISPMILHHIRHNAVLHRTAVLLSVMPDRRPRVPFRERHKILRLAPGLYHITVRLGFMQRPDVPLTLRNCELLGFDVNLDDTHYFIGHETVIRRQVGSRMGPISFATFSFLTKIASRAPDFFRIPQDRLLEVGFRLEI
jgi:KUP system potassium uptake protein